MSWSDKYKRSIDCDNPKGFSQRAHCQGRKKKLKEQLKPFKTLEQIAKKHRLDVSFIQKQLDMGEPIEHEHTKDHELAMEIALQHLDEIPDYYTRLKKMEASAKKEHKKFKDVKEATDGVGAKSPNYNLHKWFDDGGWVQAGGKYDGKPCARQPGQTTKPYCRDPDDRASMDKEERNKRAAKKRREDPNPNRSGKAKMITQESAGEKDACYKKVKSRYKVWPSAYASGALVKCRKVGADNWGTKSEQVDMIRYCPKCKKDETRDECRYGQKYWDMYSLPSNLGKKYTPNTPHPGNMPEGYDHEYSMARSELSTIISAAKRLKKKVGKGEGSIEAWVQSKITKAADYLDSAADYVDSGEMKAEGVSFNIGPKHTEGRTTSASRKLQKMTTAQQAQLPKEKVKKVLGTDLPRIKKESVSIEDADGNHYAEFIDIIKPKPLKPSKGIGSEMLDEAGKKCWPGYKKKGTQTLFGKTYNRCVKAEGFSNWREELGLSDLLEDWQSVNRKDKTDGLSSAAVKAYRRENPGSKLQTAVTEKNPEGKRAKRRASFCRRMKGMKSKLTSAETARDPDSNINKALRRWNCN